MPPKPPSAETVRAMLRGARLPFAEAEIRYLDEGWENWAFRAGDHVVRVAKEPESQRAVEALPREAAAAAYLAPLLPLPISVPVVHRGPGVLFSTHPFVPGVPLRDLKRPPAPGTGALLGRFVRSLHAVDPAPLIAAGVEVVDGARSRERRIARYEALAPRIFPLLNCETRSFITAAFADHVNNPAGFEYTPVVTHSDIDARNVLANPDTGVLTGVIDFGDIEIGNPATDVEEAYAGGFAALGIEDQVADFVRESGVSEALLRARAPFVPVWWLILDTELALNTDDTDLLREAIEGLNALTPSGIKC